MNRREILIVAACGLVLIIISFVGGMSYQSRFEIAPNALLTIQKNGYMVIHPSITKDNNISLVPKGTFVWGSDSCVFGPEPVDTLTNVIKYP